MTALFLKTPTLILLTLFAGASLSAQEADSPATPDGAEPDIEVTVPRTSEPVPAEETPDTDAKFSVPKEMGAFEGHVGRWRGDSKTIVKEGEERRTVTTRSVWNGGYLLSGHLFQIQGYAYGDLGRTDFRWHYSFDSLKQRYMAVYHDSNGRTAFFEGVMNPESTKIVWRLIHGPGDMEWEVETDLITDDGIETTGKIVSEDYAYDMIYGSLFKRETPATADATTDVSE